MNQYFKLGRILSIVMTVMGIALVIYMITVEGELGALPLFLTLTGLVWFVLGLKKRKQ